LGFVALSNYVGWTALVEVSSAKEICEHNVCQRRIRVRGSQKSFLIAREPAVKPGDFVDIKGKCSPGCKLTVVAIRPRASGERISLVSQNGE
jgi:hypothetical protein